MCQQWAQAWQSSSFQFRSRSHWATLQSETGRGKLTLQIIDPHGNLLQIIFTNAIYGVDDFSKLWCFVSDYPMLCHIRRRQWYIKQMRMNILLVCVFVLLFSFWMVPMETIKLHINRFYCIYECVFDYARIRLLQRTNDDPKIDENEVIPGYVHTWTTTHPLILVSRGNSLCEMLQRRKQKQSNLSINHKRD